MGILTILPTTIAAGDWTLAKAKAGAVFGYSALSRNQFIRLCFNTAHPDKIWLSEGESLAVVGSVVGEYYLKHPGFPFSDLGRRLGFWRSLQRFMNECRRAWIPAGKLADILKAGGVGSAQSDLMGGLYDAYAGRLDSLRVTDSAGAEAGLCDILKSSFDRLCFLADADVIHIRGIYDVKPATFEWILELARHIPTTLFLPSPKDHPRSIRWLEWTYRKFEYLEDTEPGGLTVQSEDLQSDRALSDLLPRLFTPMARLKEDGLPLLPASLPLRILEGANPREEIHEIARRVRSLLDGGAKSHRIAVLFRKPQTYPDALDAFGRFGIPVEISPDLRAEWTPEPLSRDALDFAHLAANGCDREDLIGWIGRGSCAATTLLQDPDLGAILREARVINGDTRTFSGRMDQYAATCPDKPRGQKARRIASDLRKILDAANALDRPATAARYLRRLQDSLKALGLFDDAVSKNSDPFRAKLDRLEKLLEGWNEDLEPHILVDLAEASLSGEGTTQDRRGIKLLTVDDISSIDVDHLFVAGMVTGSFPREPQQEVFLKDWQRLQISKAYAETHDKIWGGRLAGHRPFDTAKEERLHENFLFFLCMSQPTGSVTISYPRLDRQGRPATASPYIDEICKQFAQPSRLILSAGEAGPRTFLESEMDAVSAIDSGSRTVSAPDPGRIRWIAGVIDIERKRERFYLERDREKRRGRAFEYTGRLRMGGPFWKKEDMSVGALEAFAGCGFKGFAREIARIRKVDLPETGLSSKDMGTLLHRFLENLWRELKRVYAGSKRDIQAVMETAARIAPAALDDAAREMSWRGAEGPLWESQKSALRYLIESILIIEKKNLVEGYWPKLLEEPILLPIDNAPGALPGKLRGRIDRMDVGEDGSLKIMDYKVMGTPTLLDKKRKLGVTELQLPLYAKAMISADDLNMTLLYVSLRHAAKPVTVWTGTRRELTSLLNIRPILDRITAGQFDVTPEDETLCQSCEFRPACRIREVLRSEDKEQTDQ